MAGTLIPIPANGASDWTDFITRTQKQSRGHQSVLLSELDSDLEPEVLAGSVLDVGGSIYEFESDEAITGWGAIASDTSAWVKVIPSGSTCTVEFTDVTPAWSVTKQGWYDGADRYIAMLYKDVADGYTSKEILAVIGPQVAYFGGVAQNLTRPLLFIEHIANSGGDLPAEAGAGWLNRPVNTESVNEIGGASLDVGGRKIILPAGTYDVSGSQQCNQTGQPAQNRMTSRLYNTTDAVQVLMGVGDWGYELWSNVLSIQGRFTLTGKKELNWQRYSENTNWGSAWGYAPWYPWTCGQLQFWKVA